MSTKRIIRTVAYIELSIGLVSIFGSIIYQLLLSTKPLNIFIFVILSAAVSSVIGFGIFNYKEWARILVIFFSGYILLTKVMMITGLLQFEGEIITFIPAGIKNIVSILYHLFLLLFFTRPQVKAYFLNR